MVRLPKILIVCIWILWNFCYGSDKYSYSDRLTTTISLAYQVAS